MNTLPTLVQIHGDNPKHRVGWTKLEQAAASEYHAESLRGHCISVCLSCEECQKQRAVSISHGPMKHLSLETRRQLCVRLGLTMGRTLLHTEDFGTMNPATHDPIRVECVPALSRVVFWTA